MLVVLLAALLAWAPAPARLSVRVVGDTVLLRLSGVASPEPPRAFFDGTVLPVEPIPGAPGRFRIPGLPGAREAELVVEAGGAAFHLARVAADPPFAELRGPAPGRALSLQVRRPGLVQWVGDPARSWYLPIGIQTVTAPPRGTPWRLRRLVGEEDETVAWDMEAVLAAWSEQAALRPSPGKELSGQVSIPAELRAAVLFRSPLADFEGWGDELVASAPDPRVARQVWNRIHGWRSLTQAWGLTPAEPTVSTVPPGPAPRIRIATRAGPPTEPQYADCPVLADPPPGYGLVESLAHEGDVPLPGNRGGAVHLRWPDWSPPDGRAAALLLGVEAAPPDAWYRLSEYEVGGDGFRVEFPAEPGPPGPRDRWLVFEVDAAFAPPPGVLLELREFSSGPERRLRLRSARVEAASPSP